MTSLELQQQAPAAVAADPRGPRPRAPWVIVILTVLVSGAIASGVHIAWVSPVIGFSLAVGLPTYLLCTKVSWHTPHVSERIAYSLAGTLAGLMVIGLLLNSGLPLIGVDRPLSRVPVVLTVAACCLALSVWRWERTASPRTNVLRALAGADRLVLSWGVVLVLLVVMGANRLNNGAGSGVTVLALFAAAGLLVLLLIRRDTLQPGSIVAGIYLAGLALLLMTSLRGWGVTGHDVQGEFVVFQLTSVHDHWLMSRLQDPYNACLSISILPTMLQRVVGISDPYIYKVAFQVIFAICPVMVYLIARRFSRISVALLAAAFFVAFPTYFTDMPFLIRQEVGFIFVGAIVLLATNTAMSVAGRRSWIAVFSVGMVLAHYSTTYVMCAVLILAWAGQGAWRLAAAVRPGRKRPPSARISPSLIAAQRPVLGLLSILVLAATAFTWTHLITDTSGGLAGTLSRAAASVAGRGEATSSSDVRYSLFFAEPLSQQERMDSYRQAAQAQAREGGIETRYPRSLVDDYPTPVVSEPELPVTRLGSALSQGPLDVSWLNWILRQAAAKLFQLFVLLGLVAALFRSRRLFVSREYYALGWASVVVVTIQVLLPGLSADYGVLRTFQQSLFILAPFLALGCMTVFARLGARWEIRSGYALLITFFLSLTGAVPQVLGGYPAQLQLNNSGRYYDLYYPHPQEKSAISWLQGQLDSAARRGQPTNVHIEQHAFTRLAPFANLERREDVYPALLRRNSYVFLGHSATGKRQATVSYGGDLITYQYPIELLNTVKDRVYSSQDAEIYR